MEYKLIYHAGIPGRGEFIRLIFEATNTPYDNQAQSIGQECVLPYLKGDFEGKETNPTPFASPILVHNNLVLSQTSNIALYLSSHLPSVSFDDDDTNDDGDGNEGNPAKKAKLESNVGENDKWHANALFLTLMDWASEVHNVHHPISTSLFYEDQKPAAVEAAKSFRSGRVPKYLSYFERILKDSGSGYLLNSGASYVDTTLFHVIDGLKFAFPRLMTSLEKAGDHKLVFAHHSRIANSSRIKTYRASERWIGFNENGLFRPYPELDEAEASKDE